MERAGESSKVEMQPVIQIAGIRSQEEAEMLIERGVRYLGFPHRLEIHEEDTSEEETKSIISGLPANVNKVLITYLDRAKDITRLAAYLGTNWVQIHGDIGIDEIKEISKYQPRLGVIKSLVVRGDNEIELQDNVRRYSPYVTAFITDSFDPETGGQGATGKTHDWGVSRRIVENSERPVILAGGLTPSNVAAAIAAVRPAGVDSHTGVEDAQGCKDPALVESFVKEAMKAFEVMRK